MIITMCDDKSKHLAELLDVAKDREHWIDLSDYDVAKVCRYLMEFIQHDYPQKDAILSYLNGVLDDIRHDDYLDHFQTWCV